MTSIRSLQKARFASLALLVACLGLIGIWSASAFRTEKPSFERLIEEKNVSSFRDELRNGVGREVRFAADAAQVRESVQSVDAFILGRSGMGMSDETRRKLERAERNVLAGKGHRLSVDDLSAAMVEIVTNRLATLTNEEIEKAVAVYKATPDGDIALRSMKGEMVHRDDFLGQLKAGREWSKRGDVALQASLRPMIGEEINQRISSLIEASPEQFGNLRTEGATPVQAILLAYSIAADDPLNGSKSDLKNQMIRHRMERKEVSGTVRRSGKAYGPAGELFSSPAHLLFNKEAVGALLDRVEGGKGK